MPNTDSTVTRVEESLDNRPTARQIKANPSTKRIRRRPTPGQPWANVENRRRKRQFSFVTLLILGDFELGGNSKESVLSTLLGVVREKVRWSGVYAWMMPRFKPIIAA